MKTPQKNKRDKAEFPEWPTRQASVGRRSQGAHLGAHVATATNAHSQSEREPDLTRNRRKLPQSNFDLNADASAQMNQIDHLLKRAQAAAIATWPTDAEEYWINAVKVSAEVYMKFASMAPAERATSRGSGTVLGLRMPDGVPLLEKILRASRTTCCRNKCRQKPWAGTSPERSTP